MELHEILKILTGYANSGATTEQLANTYESLVVTAPIREKEKDTKETKEKEERTKEEKETEKKILSLIAGKKDKEDFQSYEIDKWIRGAQNFNLAQLYAELCITTKTGKDLARQRVHRLCKDGTLEKLGNKTGDYRTIQVEHNEQAWWEADGKPLPMKFPLGVHDFAKVFPGNIILLEGQKSQGKSSFAMEFARLNEHIYPDERVLYQNVEMANDEIKDRIKAYENDSVWTKEKWMNRVKFVRRHDAWWDLIQPNGLNVVDYLIEYDKAYLLADYIWQIHKKLKDGVAMVVVQRDPLKPYPSGGRATRDIPRLILSLIHHKIRLEDVKTFWETLPHNPTGMTCKYKKVHWWKFMKDGDWHTDDEEKYEGYQSKEKKTPLKVVDETFVHEEEC
jgi:hypothetical protein